MQKFLQSGWAAQGFKGKKRKKAEPAEFKMRTKFRHNRCCETNSP
ncbi:hypothetical protein [Campylobacter sp.]|nr:hypothetical protein [Campylobacter sp.]MDY3246308.1 hypothetical protein [Campylobacter sp.]